MAEICCECDGKIKERDLVYCENCRDSMHENCANDVPLTGYYCSDCIDDVETGCPDRCPNCGQEGSVLDRGGECICAACNYYL